LFDSPSPHSPPLKGGEIRRNLPSRKGKLRSVPTIKGEEIRMNLPSREEKLWMVPAEKSEEPGKEF